MKRRVHNKWTAQTHPAEFQCSFSFINMFTHKNVFVVSTKKLKTTIMTERGYTLMEQELIITEMEVKEMLGISKSHAYKIVRDLNKELKAKGCLTIAGKVNRVTLPGRLVGIE